MSSPTKRINLFRLSYHIDLPRGLAEHSHRSQLATDIVNTMKADLANFLDIPSSHEILIMQGGGSGQFAATVYNMTSAWVEKRRQKVLKEIEEISEDDMLKELRQQVESELRVDYLVTGSKVASVNPKTRSRTNTHCRWSLKASQEAARLLGPEYVNVASDARTANEGKFGKIPDESSWKLGTKSAMVYLCENEVSSSLFGVSILLKLSSDGRWCRVPKLSKGPGTKRIGR